MDIKDINIRNLQMETIRLRNLLAERDALVKKCDYRTYAQAGCGEGVVRGAVHLITRR